MATAVDIRKTSRGKGMSLEVASRLFDWSSIALAIGACIVFVATAAIVWLGIIKEHHWDLLREHANEKIVSVELEAAKSNAEAAKAHERIAELSTHAEQLRKDAAEANAKLGEAQANIARAHASIAEADARTKVAELRLEQLRRQVAPRVLKREALIKALEGQPKAPTEVLYLRDDAESMELAQQIALAMEAAGWQVTSRLPIPPSSDAQLPTAMTVGGQPTGVTVVVAGTTLEESEATEKMLRREEWVRTPFTVLTYALGEALGRISSHAGGDSVPPQGALRVVVSPRI